MILLVPQRSNAARSRCFKCSNNLLQSLEIVRLIE